MSINSITLWLSVLWLLVSQVAGAALVFAPLTVLLNFRNQAAIAGELAAHDMLIGLDYAMTASFIGLGTFAWYMLIRNNYAVSVLLGFVSLLPGIALFLLINLR